MFDQYRRTSSDKIAGVLRLVLGVMFLMAGVLKIVVPSLGQAFFGQLEAANIPLEDAVFVAFPIAESVLGILLLVGFHSRLSAAAAAISMVVATYVHIVVEDPSLFPLQPIEPVGPLMLLFIALYVVWKGGGSWSIDLSDSMSV